MKISNRTGSLLFLDALLLFLPLGMSIFFAVILWFFYLIVRFYLSIRKNESIIDDLVLLFFSLYSLFNVFPASYSFTYFGFSASLIFSVLRKTYFVVVSLAILIDSTKNIRSKYEKIALCKIQNRNIFDVYSFKHWFFRLLFIVLFLYGLGLIAKIGLKYFSNIRENGKLIFFIGNSYAQILLIPASLFFLLPRKVAGISKYGVFFERLIVLLFWLVYILGGARKEIFILLMSLVGGGVLKLRKHLKLIFFLGILFLGLAFIREGFHEGKSILIIFNEYMLPQYVQFVAESNILDFQKENILAFSGFSNGYNALVPSFLRLREYSSLGESIMRLPYIPLGIGAHPLGEAVLNFGQLGYVIFVLSFTLFYNIIFRISIKFPEVLIVSIGYLAVIGRSDFWLTVFFISYSSIILIFLRRRLIIN